MKDNNNSPALEVKEDGQVWLNDGQQSILVSNQDVATEILIKTGALVSMEINKPLLNAGIYPIPGLTWYKSDWQTERIFSTGGAHKKMPLRGECAVISVPESLSEKSDNDIWKEIYMDFKDGEGWISFSKRMSERFAITRR